MVDSIQQVPLYKNIYTVLNTIIGGYYNTKYVGIGPYSKAISFNRLERPLPDRRTYDQRVQSARKALDLPGLRHPDEDFKGASEIEVMFRRQLLRKLTVTYRNDAIQLSSGVNALSENNILSSIFFMKEYRDGILLFDISNKEVWNKPMDQQAKAEAEWIEQLNRKYPVNDKLEAGEESE